MDDGRLKGTVYFKPAIGLFEHPVKDQIYKDTINELFGRLAQIEQWILKREECEMEEVDDKVQRNPFDALDPIWQRLEMIERWMAEYEREGQEYGREFEERDEKLKAKIMCLEKNIEWLKEFNRRSCQHIAVQHPVDLAIKCGLCGAFY